ncbi:MerR family transcriptional regulator [Arthrobacter gandavensis]|uniref:MerR family transcriptional regulator n=1 Tax=Arthrobacter gandavensis TaxID=169960 RepID=UPI00188EBAB5|nr:MerR family transcriptional regulator [Arthrobacter gandavensis]MBF4995311.1 MerR family transcriptional regulator [Arthrobacter gandavensis]
MRSSELAQLSGLTVRALRHYHQVGVLDEPRRSSNDYREYDVHDLVRVLRIKRLAALGIPLERMPALLDDKEKDAGKLLDELEAELTQQIDRLIAQRNLVVSVRAHRATPDLPPELAPFVKLFANAQLPTDVSRADRDQAVLLAHLAGDDGMPHIVRIYERLSAPDLIPVVSSLVERFAHLDPGTSEEDADDLIDTFVGTMQPILASVAEWERPNTLHRTAHLLDEQTAGLFNARQRAVLGAIEQRLDSGDAP